MVKKVTGVARIISNREVLAFDNCPNAATFGVLYQRLLERAGAVRTGRCEGGVMTARAMWHLMMLVESNLKPEVASSSASVQFACALICFVRVAEVKEALPNLLAIVDGLQDKPRSILGQAAAYAAWVLGNRSRNLEPFIGEIMGQHMAPQMNDIYPKITAPVLGKPYL